MLWSLEQKCLAMRRRKARLKARKLRAKQKRKDKALFADMGRVKGLTQMRRTVGETIPLLASSLGRSVSQ